MNRFAGILLILLMVFGAGAKKNSLNKKALKALEGAVQNEGSQKKIMPLIDIGSYKAPPYTQPDYPEKGFVSAILTKAFKRAGIGVRINYMPFKKVLKAVDNEHLVGVYPLVNLGERKDKYLFSAPIAKVKVVMLKKRAPDLYDFRTKEQQAIAKKKICIPHDINVIGGYELDESLIVQEGETAKTCYNALKNSKVEYVVDFKLRSVIMSRDLLGAVGSVSYVGSPLILYEFRFAMNKDLDGAEELIGKLNVELQKMVESGETTVIKRMQDSQIAITEG